MITFGPHQAKNSAFRHAKNARIEIIKRRRKISPGYFSPFIHAAVSNDSEGGQ